MEKPAAARYLTYFEVLLRMSVPIHMLDASMIAHPHITRSKAVEAEHVILLVLYNSKQQSVPGANPGF